MRTRAINVPKQSKAVADFHKNTRHALAELIGVAGVNHPGKLNRRHLVRRIGQAQILLADEIWPRVEVGAMLAGGETTDVRIDTYWERVKSTSFHVVS